MSKGRLFVCLFVCLFVSLSLLTPALVSGQQALIKVIDLKSRETIPFAHVCLEGMKNKTQKHLVTDLNGKAVNDCKERSKLAISFVGYETYLDTVKPGQNITVELKPTVLSMNEVVVTAQYTPEKVDKSIYKINVINSRQIEQKGANTLTDLLQGQLNMRVSQDAVLGTSLSLQGMSGENVKFLMDGVPIIGRMNGGIDLSQINLNNVDHVEIIEGPMSVIYGSNALAGVINIITKENKVAKIGAHVDPYYESVGVFNIDGGVSVNRKRNVFSFEGGRHFFDGYSVEDTTRSKTWKPKRQYMFDTYYIYALEKTKIKLAAQYFNEKLEDKGNLLPPYHETAFDSYYYTIRYSGRLEGSHQFDKTHFVNFLGSWSAYDRIKNTYFNDLTTLNEILTTNPEDQDTTKMSSWMLRSSYALSDENKQLNYQGGVDLNSENGSGKRILGTKQQIGDYAAYLSLKYEPVAVLSIQPGFRFIYNTKYTAPLVYSLSTKWNINEVYSLRASYSRGFRAPALKELYLYFVDINHNVQGNPNLKAENSNNFNFNLAFNHELKDLAYRAELNGFYNDIHDIITLAQRSGTLYTYVNVDRYKTLGGELKVGMNIYPHLTVNLGFAETGRLNSVSSSQAHVSEFKYTPDVSSDLTFKIPKQELSFSVFYKYNGKMPQLYLQKDTIVEGFVSAYNTMDITANKGFLHNRIRFSTGVKNVFNNTTIAAVGSTGGAHSGSGTDTNIGWGRTFFVKLSFIFNQYN